MPDGKVKMARLLILWCAKKPQDVQRNSGMINAVKIANLFMVKDTKFWQLNTSQGFIFI